MKLTICTQIALPLALLASSFSAYASDKPVDSLAESLRQASTSGQFRLGYINVDPDVAGSNATSAAAFAGQIKLESAPWQGLQFAIAPYFVEKIAALSGDEPSNKLNGDFFDSNNDSFAYLGEAYVNYSWGSGRVRIGRQLLDNPFINPDEVRLLPNTFDATWFIFNLSDALSVEAGVVTRWAGFDSGASQDVFKDASNDGVSAVGANYKLSEDLALQGWYYTFDKNYDLLYVDASYTLGKLELALQYADYSEQNASNVDGSVLGLALNYKLDKFSLSFAINEASNAAGKSVDLGLGGGNFYTSMDETTIGGINDASAYLLSAEYAATEAFTASLAYGHFEDGTKASHDLDELDLILSYNFSDNFNLEFIHTSVDNSAAPADAGTNFSRQLLRMTYSF